MTKRLLALMVAAVVAGAPEALEACRLICATVAPGGSTTRASGNTHHHAHQQAAPPTGQPGLRAVPYACGPDSVLLPSAATRSMQVTVTPPIAATVQAFPVPQSTSSHSPSLQRKPPGLVLLTGALRI